MNTSPFEPYLDHLAEMCFGRTTDDEVRKARAEHAALTGWFDDNEPWFEDRMTQFQDWYLLDRMGPDGLTPAERHVSEFWTRMDDEERAVYSGLAATHRSIFRIETWDGCTVTLSDFIGGGIWGVCQTLPMGGFAPGDVVDTRLVPLRDEIHLGRTLFTHPREAHDAILDLIELCRSRRELDWDLADKLLAMRLKYDRNPGMRIWHVYRDPRLTIL